MLAGPRGCSGADHWALGGSVTRPECVAQPGARRASPRGPGQCAVAAPGRRLEHAGVLTTDLRASRPLLMKMASCSRSPDAPERLTFSEPPRSARQSCETTIGAAVSCPAGAVSVPTPTLARCCCCCCCCCCCVTVSNSSEWAREERSFIIVAARRLLASALASSPSALRRVRIKG